MSVGIRIEKATADDARDIWLWRNDAQTRAMSLTAGEVCWNSHSAWYAAALVNPSRVLFIGTLAGEKVGLCRFDVSEDGESAEVGINLNPAMRGRRLSAALLSRAITEFRKERPAFLTATIRKSNSASIKCFCRCGFSLQRADAECNYYVLGALPSPTEHS